MKTRHWMLLTAALLTGCVPMTLFPLYSDETLTFEPLLLGTWTGEDEDERWTFSAHNPHSYRLVHRDEEGRKGIFEGHLVELGGELFLDLFPEDRAEDWNDLFGMGSEPVDDPSKYPPYEELLNHFHQRREALVEWFTQLDDSRLTEPLKEEWKGFAENLGCLMSSMAVHEGMHTGQLMDVRRGLGLPRVMG